MTSTVSSASSRPTATSASLSEFEQTHRGHAQLRTFFTNSFSHGGGIDLTPCVVTDDGERCAVEYTCRRWGAYPLPPQAGIAVFERTADDRLAAVRIYDDIEAPG